MMVGDLNIKDAFEALSKIFHTITDNIGPAVLLSIILFYVVNAILDNFDSITQPHPNTTSPPSPPTSTALPGSYGPAELEEEDPKVWSTPYEFPEADIDRPAPLTRPEFRCPALLDPFPVPFPIKETAMTRRDGDLYRAIAEIELGKNRELKKELKALKRAQIREVRRRENSPDHKVAGLERELKKAREGARLCLRNASERIQELKRAVIHERQEASLQRKTSDASELELRQEIERLKLEAHQKEEAFGAARLKLEKELPDLTDDREARQSQIVQLRRELDIARGEVIQARSEARQEHTAPSAPFTAERDAIEAELQSLRAEQIRTQVEIGRLNNGWQACDADRVRIDGLYKTALSWNQEALARIQHLEGQLAAGTAGDDWARQQIEDGKDLAARLQEARDTIENELLTTKTGLENQKQLAASQKDQIQRFERARMAGNEELNRRGDHIAYCEDIIQKGQKDVSHYQAQIAAGNNQLANARAEISILKQQLEKKAVPPNMVPATHLHKAITEIEVLRSDLAKEQSKRVNFSQRAIDDLENKSRSQQLKAEDLSNKYFAKKKKNERLEAKMEDIKDLKHIVTLQEHKTRMQLLAGDHTTETLALEKQHKQQLKLKHDELSNRHEEIRALSNDLLIANSRIDTINATRPAYQSTGGKVRRYLEEADENDGKDETADGTPSTRRKAMMKRTRKTDDFDDLFDGPIDTTVLDPRLLESDQSTMQQ